MRSVTMLQLFPLILLSSGLMNHVIMMPILLQFGEKDSWIGVLVASVFLLIWVPLIVFISKRTKQEHIVDFISARSSKVSTFLFASFMFIYFTVYGYVTLFSTISWTTNTYLKLTPNPVLALPYLLLCGLAAYYGIRTIAFTAGILLPIVVSFGFLVGIGNIKEKDYTLLLPVFENGANAMWISSFFAICGFAEIVFILFLQHRSRTKLKKSHLYVLAFLLFGLALGPLVGAITIFGIEEAQRMKYPAFSQWRILELGKYLTRLDFFSIFQWVAGAFTRQAVGLYVVADLLGKQTPKARFLTIMTLCFLLWLTLFLPFNEPVFTIYLSRFYMPFSFVFALIVIAWLWLVSFKKVKTPKKRRDQNGASF
ncbi:endospore germination permease [Shouchella sp. JSM 1781072]|uniref:GerAB/ArcD/ProY family transporter n=1 Tax=Bacillaceae TaxID=186817 RepID=UPI0020D1DBD3|nr:endospore germination permease [Alkalihalobacillus sp. LMS6]UTR05399.1 endospore germination permease [Alkalihalobacillus sp. LMS6]